MTAPAGNSAPRRAWALIEYDAEAVSGSPGTPAPRQNPPRQRLQRWLDENLFSSWRNACRTFVNASLTATTATVLLMVYRELLNFVFSEERTWDAVRFNLRLLFMHAYPEEQFTRVWVSSGVIVVLAGLSLGLFARFAAIPLKKVSIWLMMSGGCIALGVVLCRPAAILAEDGEPLRGADEQLLRQSLWEAMAARWLWWLAAAVLFGAGSAVWYGLRGRINRFGVAAVPFALILLGLPVLSTWLHPWGHFAFIDGEYVAQRGSTVAASTKIPWTVMWSMLVAAWLAGGALRSSKSAGRLRFAVNLSWLMAPFVIYWVVLRDPDLGARGTEVNSFVRFARSVLGDPDLELPLVWAVDVPLALAFAIGGAVVLWLLTRPAAGEPERVLALALVVFSALTWLVPLFGIAAHWLQDTLRFAVLDSVLDRLVAFFDWPRWSMLQKTRLSFLLLALAALLAPNFVGVRAQRVRLAAGWLVAILFLHYLVTMVNTPSTVDTPTGNFVGGFSVTLFVATLTLLFSFPIGVALALARTSRMPVFRLMSTWYIEFVRGVPLITILIFFSIMVPLFLPDGMDLEEMAAIVVGYTLFSAAYLAENVRGGLQAVRRGQYEASDALGLTAAQRTGFVVLPQALRVSIPPLVGQVIATFKETSLIAVVGGFDFLRIAHNIIPAQSEFVGANREALLFVSAVYWLVAFSMSKYSQRLEKRLGLRRG